MLASVQDVVVCERQRAREGVAHDELDVKAAEHAAAPHVIGIDHTGRRFAGGRPRGDAFQEQSILPASSALPPCATVATGIGDVGGRGGRTRVNLKNPSTTRDAQSIELQHHQRVRGPTTDGAASKWSIHHPPKTYVSVPPGPFNNS